MPDIPELNNPDKYKWTAFYSDGTELAESEYAEDRSKQEQAALEGRSAYYDVDHSKLIAFMITDGEHEYSVELATGTFEIDCVPFRMHSLDNELTAFELIWNKRHWHYSDGSPSQTAYRIGWRAKDANGQPVQQIMEVL